MCQIVDVDTGQVAVRQGRFILRANAIGSCIAAAVYDAKTKTAGMAHIMLPGRASENIDMSTKYAVDAIEHMLALMVQTGAVVHDVEACLIGAGNVLRSEDDTICKNNIQSVTTILTEKRIPIRASNLGGFDRKSAMLNTETGALSHTQGDGPVIVLWQFSDPENQ